MQQSQQPSDQGPSTRHEVRTYEAQGPNSPEHVVEVETTFDKLSLSATSRELARLQATPNFEYAEQASLAAEMMRSLADAVDRLDRSTAVLKMTVGQATENESNRVKVEFLLNGGIDGYSVQEMADAARRADELDRKAGVKP